MSNFEHKAWIVLPARSVTNFYTDPTLAEAEATRLAVENPGEQYLVFGADVAFATSKRVERETLFRSYNDPVRPEPVSDADAYEVPASVPEDNEITF